MNTLDPFHNESACQRYLLQKRWPDGVQCARCERPMQFKSGRLIFKCSGCDKELSATAGTLFHKSRLPLHVWFRAMRLILESQDGISALHLQKVLHVRSYRAVWLMAHKIRAAMATDTELPNHATSENRRFVPRQQIHPKTVAPKGRQKRSGVAHGWSSKYHHAYAAEFSYRERYKGDTGKAFEHLIKACLSTSPVILRDVKA